MGIANSASEIKFVETYAVMIFVPDDWSFMSRLQKKFSNYISNALSELIQAKDIFEFVESVLMDAVFDKLYEKSEKMETVKIGFDDRLEICIDVTCSKDGALIGCFGDEFFFPFGKYSYETEVAKLKCFLLKNIFLELNGCDKFSDVLNSLNMFEILQDNVTYSLFLWHCFHDLSIKYSDIQSINGIKEIEDFFLFDDFINNSNDYYNEKDVKKLSDLYEDCFKDNMCDAEYICKIINEVKDCIEKEGEKHYELF